MTPAPVDVAVLLAVRNRAETTERFLRALAREESGSLRFTVHVVDDGSTDGTPERIRAGFPDVHLVRGDGSLYWGGGMRLAERSLDGHDHDFVLWANDDADLVPGAVRRLVETASSAGGATIVCGAMADATTGATTYSGVRRVRRWHRFLRLARVEPGATAQRVESFNGNLVLFPRDVYRRLGGIDPGFTHHYGDFDTGLRATALGIPVVLAPGVAGYTSRNLVRGGFGDPSLPRRVRVERLLGPKGYPPREKLRYLRRHGGAAWPVQLLGVYAAQLLRITLGRPA
ncbi:glycosyltransferase family 2 protein [Cellulosimicrobium sp. NPDC057127]|uniref:glycosyltransferase family 2 protein n=1 Tax=Cellulosimicrobium sp. NPDC057127 TaxID=3346026 RepID=UPI003635DC27